MTNDITAGYHGWYMVISHVDNRITFFGRHDGKNFIEIIPFGYKTDSMHHKYQDKIYHSVEETFGDILEVILLPHIPYNENMKAL